jgi:hypothetical protein
MDDAVVASLTGCFGATTPALSSRAVAHEEASSASSASSASGASGAESDFARARDASRRAVAGRGLCSS